MRILGCLAAAGVCLLATPGSEPPARAAEAAPAAGATSPSAPAGPSHARIDGYALAAPPEAEGSVAALAAPLTRAEHERLALLAPEFFRVRLELESHPDGSIAVPDSGPLRITLAAPPGAEVMAELRRGGVRVAGTPTFWQHCGASVEVLAAFPEPADHVLRLYHRERGRPEGTRLAEWVADYRVTARTGATSTFPEVFDTFRTAGARLFGPTAGALPAGKAQEFRISVPGALAVEVRSGRSIVPLKLERGVASGSAVLAPGEVLLAARFPAPANLAYVLLRYSAR